MELEHRSPKSRYLRTSRKDFEKQLGRIERRQARIRRIRQKLDDSKKIRESFVKEKGPQSTDITYHIGKTQNHPLDVRDLAQKHRLDPAARVSGSDLSIKIRTQCLSVFDTGIHEGFEGSPLSQSL